MSKQNFRRVEFSSILKSVSNLLVSKHLVRHIRMKSIVVGFYVWLLANCRENKINFQFSFKTFKAINRDQATGWFGQNTNLIALGTEILINLKLAWEKQQSP